MREYWDCKENNLVALMNHITALLTTFHNFLLADKWTYTQEHFLTLACRRALGSAAYDPSAISSTFG